MEPVPVVPGTAWNQLEPIRWMGPEKGRSPGPLGFGALTRNGGAPVTATARVLDAVEVALSGAVQQRAGGLGPDPLVVLEVQPDDQVRVLIGERPKMLQALLQDRLIDRTAAHFLSHPSPRHFVWLVICWTDATSVLLHSVDVLAQPDRRAS